MFSDVWYVLLIVTLFSGNTLLLEPMQEEIHETRAVNAMLWEESTIIGERYDACKKQIRRKR